MCSTLTFTGNIKMLSHIGTSFTISFSIEGFDWYEPVLIFYLSNLMDQHAADSIVSGTVFLKICSDSYSNIYFLPSSKPLWYQKSFSHSEVKAF